MASLTKPTNPSPKHAGNLQRVNSWRLRDDDLVKRPELDLTSLDGLRAAACFAVIAFHCVLYWGMLLDWDTGNKVLESSLGLQLAMHGSAGVDIFLALTGLWAAYHLVPALEKSCQRRSAGNAAAWPLIWTYYRKRAATLLPAYLSTLLLVGFAMDHTQGPESPLHNTRMTVFQFCPKSMPLNFLFLNNFAGFGACGTFFWSLAVQIHFYIFFPLILLALRPSAPGFRKRVKSVAIATFIASGALRWLTAILSQTHFPLPGYTHLSLTPEFAAASVRYYHPLYFSTLARLGNLATGVLLGLLFLSPKSVKTLRRYKALVSVATIACCLGTARLILSKAELHGTAAARTLPPISFNTWNSDAAFAALAYHGSPLYCLAAGMIILSLALHVDALSTAVAKMLSTKPVLHIAQLSYHVYLMHMVALYFTEGYVLPRNFLPSMVPTSPLQGFMAILCTTLLASYVSSLVHNWMHATLFRFRFTKNKAA